MIYFFGQPHHQFFSFQLRIFKMDKTVSSMMTSIFALESEAPGFLRYLVPYLFDQMDDGDVESVLTDEWVSDKTLGPLFINAADMSRR